MQIEYDIEEIGSAARQVTEWLKGQKCRIVLMEGEMGAGKTTLTKAICGFMGAEEDEVTSPTFAIVNEYDADGGEVIYHFDFYRIKSEREAVDFGLYDYMDSGRWCFMEWSERVAGLLPEDVVTVRIDVVSESRRRVTV